jgi:hydrogenase maturation protein HypF
MSDRAVCQCLHFTIRGAVQGVGFRPFVYRLATELGLTGWVNNSAQGVFIEVEGQPDTLETFARRLPDEIPPSAFVQAIATEWRDAVGYETFEIRPSVCGQKTAVVLPDLATCADCRREIFNPSDRRYRYPFTNCTNCGPRYSLIEALPYDRPNTSMKRFRMCPRCRSEYDNPRDRRFHAQPNACPECGPHLELWDNDGRVLADRDRALNATVTALHNGKIVAVKGLGGFHLMVDAANESAVQQLRQRKHRPDKPLALMYPSLAAIGQHCQVSDREAELLRSPQAPIVLLKRHSNRGEIAQSVAPGNPYLGVMLPYTPLHHLLLSDFGKPVVATSANLSDEPICTDELDALDRLGTIADRFLVHNRPIVRAIDDSIARVVAGEATIVRRARGYAPLPIVVDSANSDRILAVGAHLKNAIAIATDNQVFLSQHIGDLETPQALDAFRRAIALLQNLYDLDPDRIACDAHPDYLSSQYAQSRDRPVVPVQHHYAHVLSGMADNQILDDRALGVTWDGTGYGLDGTLWGGEFLLAHPSSFQRVAHWRQFRLPGGDRAIKQPKRTALGLLYECLGDKLSNDPPAAVYRVLDAFESRELKLLTHLLAKPLNAPLTSSAGRLFDGVAALLGLCETASFEGQAAMQLEFAIEGVETEETYPIAIAASAFPIVLDWEPMVSAILQDLERDCPPSAIAARFHNTLVEAIVQVAQIVGESRIVLSGGCFQNLYLIERAIARLRQAGFDPYWHRQVPPNDGGIALGQIVAALGENEKMA